MKTAILFVGDKEPVVAKESYLTIKKRLFDGSYFFEATVDKRKMIFSKTVVSAVRPVEEVKKKHGKI